MGVLRQTVEISAPSSVKDHLEHVELDHLAALVVIPDPARPEASVDFVAHDRINGNRNLKSQPPNGSARAREGGGERERTRERETEKRERNSEWFEVWASGWVEWVGGGR